MFYSGVCLWVLRKCEGGEAFVLVCEAYMFALMDLQTTLEALENEKPGNAEFVVV